VIAANFKLFKAIPITKIDKLSGLIIYPLGDLIAQLIVGEVSILRLFFVTLLGRYIYAIETPKWFGFLAIWKRPTMPLGFFGYFVAPIKDGVALNWLGKTLATTLWFNPLWIARHMLVLELANIVTGKTSFMAFLPHAISLGSVSFVMQFPVAVVVNYIIICRLNDNSRFIWASIFSGALAIYYAIMRVYF
jgi:hypothetical protein